MPKVNIVAFPFHDWRKSENEGFRTRDGHVIQEIDRCDRVDRLVVVDRPVSLVERSLRRLPSRVAGHVLLARTHRLHTAYLTQSSSRTMVLDITTPDTIAPVVRGRGWWFDVFARPVVRELLLQVLSDADIVRPQSIAWVPTVADVVDDMDPTAFVYDSLDNWLIHPVLRRHSQQAARAYGRLLTRADEVFVSGPASAKAFGRWRTDISILPNGVDPRHFSVTSARPADLPPGPTVGYAGKLASRIDAELVRDVAQRLPHVQFIFVGPVLDKSAVAPLRHTSNIRLLGDRHYSQLPAYLRHFDVGWIPHRVGEGETGGDPIKLYEYWAAGLPVVSTPIDGMERWAGRVAIATTSVEQEHAIAHALSSPWGTRVPPERTWASITERLLRRLTA